MIVIDVPGVGPTEFENEAQAEEFFKTQNKPNLGFIQGLIDRQKNQELADSLTVGDRLKMSWGNQPGVLEYLKNKGIDAEYRDGELFIGRGENARPADPSSFRDLGIDAFELAPDLLNMLATTLGGVSGSALAGFTGPAAPFTGMATVPALSAAGGFAAEKAKEGVGSYLGTYKGDGYITPESQKAALMSGVSAVPGAAFQGGKTAWRGISQFLKNRKIPERIYAGATGLGDEFADNPEIIRMLLRNKRTGTRDQLLKMSDDEMKVVGDRIKEALAGKEATYPEVVSRIKDFEKGFASGNRDQAKRAMENVLDEFEALFTPKAETVAKPTFEAFKNSVLSKAQTPAIAGASDDDLFKLYSQQYPDEVIPQQSIPLDELNFEKSRLASSARRLYENPDLQAQATKKAQKELADASRRTIESKFQDPSEIIGLNKEYHAYDALNQSMDKAIRKEAAKPITRTSLSELGVGGGAAAAGGTPAAISAVALKRFLDTTYAGTKGAYFLDRILSKGAGLSPYKNMTKTQLLLNELLKSIGTEGDASNYSNAQ